MDFIEKGEKPLERVIKEIEEEVGITKENLELVKIGHKIEIINDESGIKWIVFPFLFKTKTKHLKLNWENTVYKWIHPKEIYKYKTTPAFKEGLELLIK